MVWQLVVLPGTQTVTEVNNELMSPIGVPLTEGPESTVMVATFEPVGGGVGGAGASEPPPPPQATTVRHRAAARPAYIAFDTRRIIARLPDRRRQELP